MKFAANILPSNPAAYTLTNASIVDGQLSLSNNGTARYSFTKDVLSKLTEHFRISMYTTTALDGYAPNVYVYVTAKTATGYFNFTCTPSGTGIYSAELPFEATDYDYLTITFTSKTPVTFSLWELCPQAVDDSTTTIIEGVEQSLPKLLDDHNMYPFTIGQAEDTIALITCNLLSDTDLQGGFLLVYTAPQDCVLTLRFKDNGATELFSPLIYDLKAGRGNIGVPHAYLNRLAGLHNITVTAQVSNSTIAIATRGMLFTIDGGYLAKRVIDFGTDIRDISIRQLPSDSSPSEIWAVGIDNNEAVVRRRDYNDNTTSSYEPMFSVGEAIEAAIEFNGDWTLRQGETVYTIETEEVPYVFFVDTNGNLYTQYGGNTATKTLLDTDVSKVSACRGYKSQTHPENDQGLICAYIKGTTVFYRAYRYDTVTKSYFWDYARSVDGLGEALFVNVHRLNDYRVGIVSSTATGNLWAISDRTYVSQASKPEYFNKTLEETHAFCSMIPAVDTSELIYTARTVDQSHLTIEFNVDIRSASGNILNDIKLSGGATNADIQDISVDGNLISITLRNNAASNVFADFEPFSLMRKGMIYGWIFIPAVNVKFILPSFNAENMGLILSDVSVSCAMTTLQRKLVPYSDTIDININFTPTCTFYAIQKVFADTSENFNMNIVSEVSCTLTHVSVLPA